MLDNVFYNDTSVKTDISCLLEYNMNALIDGVSVENVEVDNTYTSDSAYRAQISYKGVGGTPVGYPIDGPIPFKKLFPLESVVNAYRPSASGIKYLVPGIGDNFTSKTGVNSAIRYSSIEYPSDKPRLYYPGISTPYKYWLGAKNKNIALKVTYKHDAASWTASKKDGPLPAGNKNAIANKIVVKFEKHHSKPISAWVVITKSNGEVLPNVALPVADQGADWSGEIVLYYNGTAWSSTDPKSYGNTQEIKSIQVNAMVPQVVNTSAAIGVIEISARWIKDVSSDLISMSITQESSSQDASMLPVGDVNSNTLQLDMANYSQASSRFITREYDRNSAYFETGLTYLAKGVKATPYFKVYHPNATYVSGSYDRVEQGEYFIDTYSISEFGEYSITCLDGAKQLMETMCPDIICQNYPATAIIRRLLDSVGFTKYNMNLFKVNDKVSDDSVPQINYWWTEDTQTVWEALQEICKDIQFNAFFDKSGVLQFYSRNYIYDTNREVNWEFYYDKEGIILPNIVSFSKSEIPSSNSVKIIWSSPITSNYTGNSESLWTSPEYYLTAGGLESAMSTTSDEFTIGTQTIDPYAKQESLYNFTGFVLIDSEIIEYDAIGYQYTDQEDVFVENVWIESAADISKYRYFAKSGAKDVNNYQETAYFKPNGRYRIKKDDYGKLVGRGALGTTAAAHLTANESMSNWKVWQVQM